MPAPYFPYAAIRRRAEEFLALHRPNAGVPVPIEMIVEQDLGLDIIPVPGLRYTHGRDGYLRLDRTGIVVDDQLLNPRYLTRYNFTLAHEVCHFLLHDDAYRAARSLRREEWYDLHLDPAADNTWFEKQADDFAGLVLVPTQHLLGPLLDAAIEAVGWEVLDTSLALGLPMDKALEEFSMRVCDQMAPTFEVHSVTLRIRFEREQRWPVVEPEES